MSNKNNEFPLPEMPGVCLSCGALEPLRLAKFEFRYTTLAATLLTFLSPLLGSLYARRMAYRMELPVCGGCSAHLKRAKKVVVMSVLLFLPVVLLTAFLISYEMIFFLLPFAYMIAAYAYHGVVQRRGTPKVARVDKHHLVLSVPDYGEFVLFEDEDEAGRQTRRSAAKDEPKLNRSVCEGCGFINFPNVFECKKCNAPLGQPTAV